MSHVVTLARRVAAMTSHHGPHDPRTLAAMSQWRVAKLTAEIAALTDDERGEVLAALAARP